MSDGSGRKASAQAYDAMIAATAMANELPIYTCNPADFRGIEGLEVIEVPIPPIEVASPLPDADPAG